MMETGKLQVLPANALWHFKSNKSKFRNILLEHQDKDLNDLDKDELKYFRHETEGYIVTARRVAVKSVRETTRYRSILGLDRQDLFFYRPAGKRGKLKMVIKFLKKAVTLQMDGYHCSAFSVPPGITISVFLHRGTTSFDSGIDGGDLVSDHRLKDGTTGPRSGYASKDTVWATPSENNTGTSKEAGARYQSYGDALPPKNYEEFFYNFQHPVHTHLYFSGDGWVAIKDDDGELVPCDKLLLASYVTKQGAGWVTVHVGYHGSLYRLLVEALRQKLLEEHETIDHKGGNRYDNRAIMLAIMSIEQQAMNKSRSISNTSGYVGVVKDRRLNMWKSLTKIGKRLKFTFFENITDAIDHRKAYENKVGITGTDRDSARRVLAEKAQVVIGTDVIQQRLENQKAAVEKDNQERAAMAESKEEMIHNRENVATESLDETGQFIAYDDNGTRLPRIFWTRAAKQVACARARAAESHVVNTELFARARAAESQVVNTELVARKPPPTESKKRGKNTVFTDDQRKKLVDLFSLVGTLYDTKSSVPGAQEAKDWLSNSGLAKITVINFLSNLSKKDKRKALSFPQIEVARDEFEKNNNDSNEEVIKRILDNVEFQGIEYGRDRLMNWQCKQRSNAKRAAAKREAKTMGETNEANNAKAEGKKKEG
jgi:hypothetical protein